MVSTYLFMYTFIYVYIHIQIHKHLACVACCLVEVGYTNAQPGPMIIHHYLYTHKHMKSVTVKHMDSVIDRVQSWISRAQIQKYHMQKRKVESMQSWTCINSLAQPGNMRCRQPGQWQDRFFSKHIRSCGQLLLRLQYSNTVQDHT